MLQERFTAFYCHKYQGRRLQWAHSHQVSQFTYHTPYDYKTFLTALFDTILFILTIPILTSPLFSLTLYTIGHDTNCATTTTITITTTTPNGHHTIRQRHQTGIIHQRCVLTARFPRGKKELEVSLYQALVLLCFNTRTTTTSTSSSSGGGDGGDNSSSASAGGGGDHRWSLSDLRASTGT